MTPPVRPFPECRVVWCGEGQYEPSAALVSYFDDHPPTRSDPAHLVFGVRRTPVPDSLYRLESLSFGTLMPGRALAGVPRLSYHRVSYDGIRRALETGHPPVAAFIACGTRTDEKTVSLGVINGVMSTLAGCAATSHVEVVPWLPELPGAARVRNPASFTPTGHRRDEQHPTLSALGDPIDAQVAEHVAACIPEHPTLALGIGRTPDAVAAHLPGRHDLSYLGGVVQQSLRSLYAGGAFGKRTLATMCVVGDGALVDWAAGDAHVRLLPSAKVHNPDWLCATPRFVAVLGAVEINHAGAVNSELAGRRWVSGLGGAPDFARGARLSPGGRTIVAIRSRRPDGTPTLVDDLPIISVPGADVTHVATEHGSVQLVGLGPVDRSHALREIFAIG